MFQISQPPRYHTKHIIVMYLSFTFFFPEQRFFMWFVFVLLVKCCFHFYFVLEGAINLIYEQCGHFKFGRFTFQIEGEGGACMNFLIKTSKIINYCILVKKKILKKGPWPPCLYMIPSLNIIDIIINILSIYQSLKF